MKTATLFSTGLAMLAFLSWGLLGQPANQENAEPGVEVQARGPIHEAFAQPSEPKQEPAAPIAKKPPEPIDELPPDEKPAVDAVLWIPGYWAWDEEREDFLWVSGIWRVPVPERRWMPGYWHDVSNGWQWVSGYWGPTNDTVEIYPAPPEPIDEAIPPPLNADSTYVPGNWVYREARFRWRPGHWIALRPGWVWMPARYCWTPGGYCYIEGCWDYELHDRGVCFAPVFVDVRVVRVYRPRYLVRVDFLLGSLFVNARRHHYVFGDYYDPVYARRGYQPWIDYRIHGATYDPLFAYYRWQNRAQPRWEADMRAVFVKRRDNQNDRPPRTLALQAKAPAQNQVMAVASLRQAQQAGVKLAPVPKAQVVELQKSAAEIRKISVARSVVEPKANALKSPMGTPIKVELPKATFKNPTAKKAPPPPPDGPKIVDVPPNKLPKEKNPKIDPFKDKVDPPKEKPKVDPPKEKPKVDPPKEKPKVDPPKEKPKVDPPKEKPKVDPPKEKPKVDPPKEKPKVDPPKEKPKVDPPKEKPKVDPPKDKGDQEKGESANLERRDGYFIVQNVIRIPPKKIVDARPKPKKSLEETRTLGRRWET